MAASDSPHRRLLVLYASQTGNAQVWTRDRCPAAAWLPQWRGAASAAGGGSPAAAPPGPLFAAQLHQQRLTLQDVAERIGREAQRRHYAPRVLPADAYLPAVAALPNEAAVVWVASTTGQGEHPSNMRHLWRFLLRKSLPPDSLSSLSAAVFGLGDSG